MRLFIVVIVCLFISPVAYAQDLFDQAEIEFDVDYIDIDNVQILGSKTKGQVMVVWMKSGSVLTKTLSNSKIKYSDDDSDISYSYRGIEENNIWDMSTEELRGEANRILSSEWTNRNGRLGSGYNEEMDLLKILTCLKYEQNKGSLEFVGLAMDIIVADMEYGARVGTMNGERSALEYFAEGDEQLTKIVNDFLTEKGFNKEN